jgi:predicted permease
MHFERPTFLLLLALLVPVLVLAWRSRRSEEPWKWWTSLALRTLVVLSLVFALAPAARLRTLGVNTRLPSAGASGQPTAMRKRATRDSRN